MGREGGRGRRRLCRAVGFGMLFAVAFGLGPVAATAGAATTVAIFSDTGDPVGGGRPWLFTASNASISAALVAGSQTMQIDLVGKAAGERFTFVFAPPTGQMWAAGVYDHAQRFQAEDHPGMDITSGNFGCNANGGRFEVRDIAIDANGTVTRLWLGF